MTTTGSVITPEQALKMLTRVHITGLPLRRIHVTELIRAILDPEGPPMVDVVLDPDGAVVAGRKVLLAIIHLDRPVPVMLTEGEPVCLPPWTSSEVEPLRAPDGRELVTKDGIDAWVCE